MRQLVSALVGHHRTERMADDDPGRGVDQRRYSGFARVRVSLSVRY